MKFTAIDIETGGLNPEKNGIISIAVIAPNKEKFYQIVDPYPSLSYEDSALKINGFQLVAHKTKTRWHRNGNPELLSLPEPTVLRNLVAFLKAHCSQSFIIGCHLAFDKSFLLEAAKRTDKKRLLDLIHPQTPILPTLENEFFCRVYELQSVALFAHNTGLIKLRPNKHTPSLPSLSLDSISFSLGLSRSNPREHHALDDANLTLHCLEKLQNLAGTSPVSYPARNTPQTPPKKARHSANKAPSNKTCPDKNLYPCLLGHFQSQGQTNPEALPYLNKKGFVKNKPFQSLTPEQQHTLLPLIKALRTLKASCK